MQLVERNGKGNLDGLGLATGAAGVATEERGREAARAQVPGPAPVGLVRGSPCPLCERPLELRDILVSGRSVRLLGHPVGECRWRAVFGRLPAVLSSYHLVGRWPGAPELCQDGHSAAWAARVVAGRLDLVCLAAVDAAFCGYRLSVGPPRGFLAGRESLRSNFAKAAVLGALRTGGRGTPGTLAHATGLSLGQVAGVLRRCSTQGAVERSAEKVHMLPQGYSYTWELTLYGKSWLAWSRGEAS